MCGLCLAPHLNKPKVKSTFKMSERKNKLKLAYSLGLGNIYFIITYEYSNDVVMLEEEKSVS